MRTVQFYSEIRDIAALNYKEVDTLNNLKIIGITGTTGKSTTACLIHSFLKEKGFKSILYSSVEIDSPTSRKLKGRAREVAINSKETIGFILDEVVSYGAQYLVLEVNESVIANSYLGNLDFTIRVLTNILPTFNDEFYDIDTYINLKKSFVYAQDASTKVIGFANSYSLDEFEELLGGLSGKTVIYGSNYVCTTREYDIDKVDCLINNINQKVTTMDVGINLKGKNYRFATYLPFSYHSFNISCAATVLSELEVFDPEIFQNVLLSPIPGRDEIKLINNRYVLIGMHLSPALEELKVLKDKGMIGRIITVCGSVGNTHSKWQSKFKNERRKGILPRVRHFAMTYLDKYADFIYLTANDNGGESPETICKELKKTLKRVKSTTVLDRYQAIKNSLEESNEKDIIYISGRGNRYLFCPDNYSFTVFTDEQLVEKAVMELGWNLCQN